MNINQYGHIVTCDWDKISMSEAMDRFISICHDKNVTYAKLFSSSSKGYHVLINYDEPVRIVQRRRKLRDDGERLVHDIINRPPHIHDILWNKKVYKGIQLPSASELIAEYKVNIIGIKHGT